MRQAIVLGFLMPFSVFTFIGCRKDSGTDWTTSAAGYYTSSANTDNVTFIKADNTTLSLFCFATTAGTSYTWDNVKMTSPTQFTIAETVDSIRYYGSGTIQNGAISFTVNDTVNNVPLSYSFSGLKK